MQNIRLEYIKINGKLHSNRRLLRMQMGQVWVEIGKYSGGPVPQIQIAFFGFPES